jgi:hypothetical protein
VEPISLSYTTPVATAASSSESCAGAPEGLATALRALHVCTQAVVAATVCLHERTLPLLAESPDTAKCCVATLARFTTRLEGLMVRRSPQTVITPLSLSTTEAEAWGEHAPYSDEKVQRIVILRFGTS